jgi:glycosyltransferase involved in cell wall biosynthesis
VTEGRSTPEISVVIPTYQRANRLPPLLESLAAQTLEPDRFEVLVADNGSADNTSDLLKELATTLPFELRVVRIEVNRGPAPARNLGWRSARAPFIAFLDDDCTPAPHWLEAALAAFADRPRAGVIQGRTRAPEGIEIGELPPWYIWQVIEAETPIFEACNIFYRRSALEVTGGFDEDIGWWGEDTAAGWRVLDAGWERGFSAEAVATHVVEPRGVRWHLRNGLKERNMIRLAAAFPAFRREAFWRSWAFRREDAAFVLAVAGLVGALRFRPAILLALPYLRWRRPSLRRGFVRLALEIVAVDAARCAGQVSGALSYRILVI